MKRLLTCLATLAACALLALVPQGTPVLLRAYGSSVTTRVSVASDGTQGDGRSAGPSISADGRYVAFSSRATTLVPGDTNGAAFVHDVQTGQTTRVSVASDGSQGNGSSGVGSISGDGRYVAFVSLATNLVPGDTNGAEDVFVHDRQTGQTTRVSVASDGTQGNGVTSRFDAPAISGNGRYVAFSSAAFNLVPGDSNFAVDVFVRDMQTGQTTRASVSTNGTQGNGLGYQPAISGDGRNVAFVSGSTNLVAGCANCAGNVLMRDRQTNQTTMVSVALDGGPSNAGSQLPAISADGRHVAFVSGSTNLVPGPTSHQVDVFVRDTQTGQTSRVSVASNGALANRGSTSPAISADGRYVGFVSSATTLVPGSTRDLDDVFVHDMQTGWTSRVSVASDGTEGNNLSSRGIRPAISADGRYVAFSASATNLVLGDTNGAEDVFVHDRGPGPLSVLYLPLVVQGASTAW